MSCRTFLYGAAVLFVCAAAHATPTWHRAGAVQQVLDVSESGNPQSTKTLCSAGWVDLAGAHIKITIPSGTHQLLTARFSADANSDTLGNIRIVAGTQVLLPAAGVPVNNINAFYGAEIAFERSGVVPGGVTRNVHVQYCVSTGDGSQQIWLTDWHLTVEAAPVQ
jgi:hypothetical protein